MSNQTTERLGKKSSSVILKDVTKIFQQPDTGKDFVAVDHINLHIQDGEMVTLPRSPPTSGASPWCSRATPCFLT